MMSGVPEYIQKMQLEKNTIVFGTEFQFSGPFKHSLVISKNISKAFYWICGISYA